MTQEEVTAEVKVTKLTPEEAAEAVPFAPAAAPPAVAAAAPPPERVEFVLEPIPAAPPTPPSVFLPPSIAYEPAPGARAIEKRPLIVDIETTGANPWESRIICIGTVDPNIGPDSMKVFVAEEEAMMVHDFLTHFISGGYNQVVGYNVSFDTRFIFAAAGRYRESAPLFFQAEIFDLMNVMKQVKREFVYGFNKPGSLDQWSKYFFGEGKTMTFEEVLVAWDEKRVDDIVEYNKNDLRLTFNLFWLVKHVAGDI